MATASRAANPVPRTFRAAQFLRGDGYGETVTTGKLVDTGGVALTRPFESQ